MEVETERATLGIDIGGANLKLADPEGRSLALVFPMWTDHERLGEAIRTLLTRFTNTYTVHPSALAVTMTGELADCFATRRAGVAQILEQVGQAFPTEQISVYAVDGSWLTPAEAMQLPWKVAASNWHALASWAHGSCIASQFSDSANYSLQAIIDVGSTTVDIVPLNSRGVATAATTDRERMQLGQLVYTGMQRTPVAAILSNVQLHGTTCPLMAERFATSDDAYVCLGLVAEVPEDNDTADGRLRTSDCARARLARMLGEDLETLTPQAIDAIAEQIIDAQVGQVASAIARNVDIRLLQANSTSDRITASSETPALLVSGHGRALMQRVVDRLRIEPERVLWLEEAISPAAARVAPAMAVAWLLKNSSK